MCTNAHFGGPRETSDPWFPPCHLGSQGLGRPQIQDLEGPGDLGDLVRRGLGDPVSLRASRMLGASGKVDPRNATPTMGSHVHTKGATVLMGLSSYDGSYLHTTECTSLTPNPIEH